MLGLNTQYLALLYLCGDATTPVMFSSSEYCDMHLAYKWVGYKKGSQTKLRKGEKVYGLFLYPEIEATPLSKRPYQLYSYAVSKGRRLTPDKYPPLESDNLYVLKTSCLFLPLITSQNIIKKVI
jgi:hypothetical protein